MPKTDEEAGRKLGDFLGGVLDGLTRHWKNLVLIVAVVTGGYGWMRPTTSGPTFSASEMRAMIRSEMAPVKAGLEALARKAPIETRLAVLEAMREAEAKNIGSN